MKLFKIMQKLLIFVVIYQYCYSQCIPENCQLLCCTFNDLCASSSDKCKQSACQGSLCQYGCCKNGKCGTEKECNSQEYIIVVILFVLVTIAFVFCCCLLIYWVVQKKSHKVEVFPNGQIVDINPEVISHSQINKDNIEIKNNQKPEFHQIELQTTTVQDSLNMQQSIFQSTNNIKQSNTKELFALSSIKKGIKLNKQQLKKLRTQQSHQSLDIKSFDSEEYSKVSNLKLQQCITHKSNNNSMENSVNDMTGYRTATSRKLSNLQPQKILNELENLEHVQEIDEQYESSPTKKLGNILNYHRRTSIPSNKVLFAMELKQIEDQILENKDYDNQNIKKSDLIQFNYHDLESENSVDKKEKDMNDITQSDQSKDLDKTTNKLAGQKISGFRTVRDSNKKALDNEYENSA